MRPGWTVAAAAAAIFLSGWFGQCAQAAEVATRSPASMSMQPSPEPKKAAVYTCPMHRNIHEHGPGRCPVCGMNLIEETSDSGENQPTKALAHAPDEHASFTLSPMRQQMIGMKTGLVMKAPLFKDIDAAGRLAFDPQLYTAQTEYAEALQELERVKKSPLPDVRESAQRMVQSAKLRLKILGLSDQQIAHIGAGDGGEANLLITKPGQSVWIYADVFEMDLPYVQAGQSAEITAGFLGGKTLAGKVVSVDRVINPTTRTAKARILVSEGSTYLRPESYVDVTIHAPLGEQVTIPFDAVLDTGKQSWVFVVKDDGRFVPTLVHVKFYAGNQVAIADGLEGGEKIVTSANFLIDSESRLKAAGEGSESSAPPCPSGQHWDRSMAMCMSN